MVFDLLVRRDPADEQKVHQTIVEHPIERRAVDLLRDARCVDRDREHPGRREAERLELLPVVLGIAQRQFDMADERSQFLASKRREAEQRRIVRREKRGRRHIVVLENAAAAQRGERRRHRRRQREVKDRQVAAPRRCIAERPNVAGQIVVDRQRVEIRVVPEAAQEIAHVPGAVAHGVATMRGRNPLVDDHGASGRA